MFEDRQESAADEAASFLSLATKNGNINRIVWCKAKPLQRSFVQLFSVLRGFRLYRAPRETPNGLETKYL